jgi:N-acetylmuramoyl-L-alanine amidase
MINNRRISIIAAGIFTAALLWKTIVVQAAPLQSGSQVNSSNSQIKGYIANKVNNSEVVSANNQVDSLVQKSAAVTGFFIESTTFEVNKPVLVSGKAVGSNKVLYQFSVKDISSGKVITFQNFSTSSTLTWIPATIGNYRVEMQVKDASSTKNFEDTAYRNITIKPASIVRINSFVTGDNFYKGKFSTITGNASSTNGVLYQFWIMDYSTNQKTMARDFSSNAEFRWLPTETGKYRIEMFVKDKNSTNQYDTSTFKDVTVTSNGLVGKVIVLDPGHGGSDPGAVNKTMNLQEKNLNIALSEKVKSRLAAKGATVLTTRLPGNDVFISLQDRVTFGNIAKPDLFLSIHHDSSTSTSAAGVSTHYSSYRPDIEVSGGYVIYNGSRFPIISNTDKGYYVNYYGTQTYLTVEQCTAYDDTLNDAAKVTKILADKLVNSIASVGFSNKGSRDHSLYVTKWGLSPSILIEGGFMSNMAEASKISNPLIQDQVADKIVQALSSFYN